MKFNLTFVLLILCMTTFAQLKVSLPGKISFELPEGAVLYNDSAYTNNVARNLGISTPVDNIHKYTYRLGTTIFKFDRMPYASRPNYLKALRKNIEYPLGSTKKSSQQLVEREINGNHFLIEIISYPKRVNYNFYCISKNNDNGFSGRVNFESGGTTQAINLMEKILSSISFKN